MALIDEYFPPDLSGFKTDREIFRDGMIHLIDKIHEQDERIKVLEAIVTGRGGIVMRPFPPANQFTVDSELLEKARTALINNEPAKSAESIALLDTEYREWLKTMADVF